MQSSARLLRVFPLGTVLFPGAALTLQIFEPRYLQMISECISAEEAFGVALIREGAEAGDPGVDPYLVGTVAEISEMTYAGRDRLMLTTHGTQRFRIRDIMKREPYIVAEVEDIEEEYLGSFEGSELEREVRNRFAEYRRLLVAFSVYDKDHHQTLLPHDSAALSFIVAEALQISDSLKQLLLEMTNTKERLAAELNFLRRLLPQLQALINRRQEGLNLPRLGWRLSKVSQAEQEKYFGKFFSLN